MAKAWDIPEKIGHGPTSKVELEPEMNPRGSPRIKWPWGVTSMTNLWYGIGAHKNVLNLFFIMKFSSYAFGR